MDDHPDSVSSVAPPGELEAITRDYARYADSAGGWSAMAGGVLGLASFAIGATLAPTPAVRGILVVLPLLWILLKAASTRYYQQLGRVQPVLDPAALRIRRRLAGGITAIVTLVVIGRLAQAAETREPLLVTTGYLLAVLAIPLVGWRYLRTPMELVIGTFLFSQAALALGGFAYGEMSVAWLFVPVAVLLIGHGIRDHKRFRALQARIAQVRQSMVRSA